MTQPNLGVILHGQKWIVVSSPKNPIGFSRGSVKLGQLFFFQLCLPSCAVTKIIAGSQK